MSLKKGTVNAKEVENINAQDVSDIKTTLALENVDNTSDANKPISTDTQNALNLKADDSSISSVGKTGDHSDLNLDDGTNPHNTNQSDVGLGNVDNTSDLNKPVSNATQNALDDKVDKVAGQGLSDKNYTLAEKNKLAGIESGAEVNTVDSVNTQTGDVVLDADDINDTTTTNKFTSQSDINRLANTSGTNTGDQDISGIGVNASDITDLQNNKVDKAAGKGLSDENYTLTEKNKLAGIENGAEVNIPETITNLSITGNTLTYVNENGTNQDIDLSLYLDDTNLARIISGEYVAGDNVLRFTRDDGSTFDIDASMFFDDTNLVTSVNTQTGEVVLDADDIDDATTTNKFTSQADIDRLANTSGTNTGDQDLSNYVDLTSTQTVNGLKTFTDFLRMQNGGASEKSFKIGSDSLITFAPLLFKQSTSGTSSQNGSTSIHPYSDNELRFLFSQHSGSTIYKKFSFLVDLIDEDNDTREYQMPNKSGTLAFLDDFDINNKNLSLGENYANVKINDFVNDGFDVYPTDAGYQYAKLLQQDKLNDTKVLLLPQATKAGELGANKGSNFTASRATTATRVNENGLIESVAVNVPRIDYTNGNYPSILVEPQRTNLFHYSEQLDNAYWSKTNLSVVANAAISPDGSQNAEEIIGTSSSNFIRRIVSVNAGSVTVSCFVKSNDGTPKTFVLGAGSLGASGNSEFTATNEWKRFKITITVSTISSDFGIFNSSGILLGLYVWGMQIEQGTEASSYIPTTSSAVTRNADVLSTTVPAGVTEIVEELEDGTTNTITNIPSTYTPDPNRYKYILMK